MGAYRVVQLSASEVIPDVDIAAKVGKDLFLDEKIPRHESGQGYVRVVEHSVLCKEKEAFSRSSMDRCIWPLG